jgi:hypothetical protein
LQNKGLPDRKRLPDSRDCETGSQRAAQGLACSFITTFCEDKLRDPMRTTASL